MDNANNPGGPANKAADPAEAAAAAFDPGLIKKILIATVVVLIGIFGYMLWQALQDEESLDRWDTLEAIRVKHEPRQDPLWENPYGVYNDERTKYIAALQAFLDGEAKASGDALTPHTRFLLSKTLADHILSNPGVLENADRDAWYADAIKQLEAIRDEHPDFPLNWSTLGQDGFPNLTRQFIKWLETNRDWEKEFGLKAMDPDADVRVLVRTDRGDMLFGIYGSLAPTWTQAFLEKATAGALDGTAFVEKRDVGDAAAPGEHGFRAGGAASRVLEAFDAKATRTASEATERAGSMPEESRNRIPFQRGLVAAWHDGAEAYDSDSALFVITGRSPNLDYKYTPVGKLVDEGGVQSLLTADRIFGGPVWREDDEARDDNTLSGVLDWFQAPVRIVKVLVYKNGTLQEPETPADTRATVEASERSLSSIQADRYKEEPPVRPVVKDGDGKGEDGKGEDGKGEDGKGEDGKGDDPEKDDG